MPVFPALRPPRIGIVTTGQGPRDEYVNYHTNVLRHLGADDAEIFIRHALDGLTEAEIDSHAAKPGDWHIGCHVESPSSTGDRMGDGHKEVFVPREFMIERVQLAIDSLEAEDDVDLTIFCCAEEYPTDAFHSSKPVVLPFRFLLPQVGALFEGRESARIGLIVPSTMHIEQDLRTWNSAPWASKAEFVAAGWSSSGQAMADELLAQGDAPDLVVLFGYGMGIAPADDPRLLNEIAQAVKVPLITAHGITTLAARGLLLPAMADRAFARVE
jgi:protein AroM